MAHANKKTTIAIAAAVLLIAAIWFAWKISTFNSLSDADAKWWLGKSELLLLVSTVLLTFGLLGEWSDSEDWKKRSLYKAAKLAVIIGVVGELIGDAGIFESGDRIQELSTREILALTKSAGDAKQLADEASKQAQTAIAALNDAEKRLAAMSNKEGELEKRQSDFLDSITPPQLEYMKFTSDLGKVASVPIVIEAEPDPNSQFFARDLDAAFRQAGWRERSIVNEPISFIPGIWVKYSYPNGSREAASAICRSLSAQLITSVRVMGAMTLEKQRERFPTPDNIWNIQHPDGPSALDWPDSAPPPAAVIHVGPNSSDLLFNNARSKKGLAPIGTNQLMSADLACKP